MSRVGVAGERTPRPNWRALTLAPLAGLAIAVAHPPFGVLPGLLGFALLLWLVERADGRRPLRSAFLRGLLAGFGFFVVSLYWIAEAFFVDAAAHGWMAPIVMVILPGGMALFWGAACALTRWLAPAEGRWAALRRVAVFAAAFGLLEWVRGHLLTGFPWNLPGEAWAAGSAPSQLGSVLGAYGLSVVTVALAALPAVVLAARDGPRASRPHSGHRPERQATDSDPVAASQRMRGGRPRSIQPAALAAAALFAAGLSALYGFGAWRLAGADGAPQPTTVRIVQADIDQRDKWRPDNLDGVLDAYLALTRSPGQAAADIVIWPEGAVPSAANSYLGVDIERRTRVAAALTSGQRLLVGAFRLEPGPTPDQPLAFNTFLALRRIETPAGPDLELLATYDKHRLVPLGEFLPLRPLLEPIGFVTLVNAPADFTPGPRPRPIEAPGLPRVQPLICYESLFPRLSDPAAPRASWIVNASNDSWFGRTSGPWQHLNIAGHRAIEHGLPLIRATPTGISAVIDAYGRRHGVLQPGVAGVIDAAIPAALPRTPYDKWGDVFFWLLTLAGLLCALPRRPPVRF